MQYHSSCRLPRDDVWDGRGADVRPRGVGWRSGAAGVPLGTKLISFKYINDDSYYGRVIDIPGTRDTFTSVSTSSWPHLIKRPCCAPKALPGTRLPNSTSRATFRASFFGYLRNIPAFLCFLPFLRFFSFFRKSHPPSSAQLTLSPRLKILL